jgi:hypothetical protein
MCSDKPEPRPRTLFPDGRGSSVAGLRHGGSIVLGVSGYLERAKKSRIMGHLHDRGSNHVAPER